MAPKGSPATSTRKSDNGRKRVPANPRLPALERREQLLNAARAVIVGDGLAMVTMERVARQANVSKPVLYSKFPNRAALLRAMLESFWDEMDQRLKTQLAPDDTMEQFTTALINTYFDVLQEGGQALQQILASGADEPEIEAARRERFARIENLWSKKYQRSFDISAKRANTAAAILRSALAGAGEYWMRGNGQNRKECIAICSAVMRGAFNELQS
jgi:AcrR family transcriptional regulator